MADDEFDHIVKNSQRVRRLNTQNENHPYAEELTKNLSFNVCIWNIRFRGGDRYKIFFGWYMEFISGRHFTKQRN